MFAGKAGARDKHSSLFQKSVNYVRESFYNTGPRILHGSIHAVTIDALWQKMVYIIDPRGLY